MRSAMERLLMLPADDDLLSEQELKDYDYWILMRSMPSKFLTGPETVLALLDEREETSNTSNATENETINFTVGKLEAAKSKTQLEAARVLRKELSLMGANVLLNWKRGKVNYRLATTFDMDTR